jgi:hypothetical protein
MRPLKFSTWAHDQHAAAARGDDDDAGRASLVIWLCREVDRTDLNAVTTFGDLEFLCEALPSGPMADAVPDVWARFKEARDALV